MDTFVGIIAAGRYPAKEMPSALRVALEEAIRKHMEAYGLSKVTVITEEDDRKRACANELYEALKPIEPLLDFMILTVKMPPERLESFKRLHKQVREALVNAGDNDAGNVREMLADLRGEKA